MSNGTVGEGTTFPSTALSRTIDAALDRVGRAASWVWIVLLVAIVSNVLLRYVFGAGRIEFEELQWHLYSAGFLIGLAIADQADAHIRVDALRDRFAPQTRAWIELYGLLLLFFPFVALVLLSSIPFVSESFAQGEVSPSPGGLPMRWAIKGALPAGFGVLALAGLSRLSRVWSFLFFGSAGDASSSHSNPGGSRGGT